MPAAVIPVHVAIRTRLKESVNNTLALSKRLEGLIADKPRYPSGRFHGKVDHSPPPWYAPAANSFMDLHALSRKLERDFRGELDFPRRARGGSDANTRKALEALCRLAEGADDFMVRLGTRELDKWSRRALIILTELRAAEDYEEVEIPKRLPRQQGEAERPCPWCKNRTLRLFPFRGEVRCVNPGCHDEEGRKPYAHLKYSEHAKEMILLWQDNIPGLPEAA
jgi:hypothetical protein